jgi:hypothetical protein
MSEVIKEKLEKILRHRGMYGIETDLGRAISFVAGFDAANDGFVLKGFREWFLLNFLDNPSESFSWLFLVERELGKMGQDEKQKVNRFVEIIIEFLSSK